ncbi:MAG: hypothetical protein WCT20_04835, partial [Candidatus Babeliales bacterium]
MKKILFALLLVAGSCQTGLALQTIIDMPMLRAEHKKACNAAAIGTVIGAFAGVYVAYLVNAADKELFL